MICEDNALIPFPCPRRLSVGGVITLSARDLDPPQAKQLCGQGHRVHKNKAITRTNSNHLSFWFADFHKLIENVSLCTKRFQTNVSLHTCRKTTWYKTSQWVQNFSYKTSFCVQNFSYKTAFCIVKIIAISKRHPMMRCTKRCRNDMSLYVHTVQCTYVESLDIATARSRTPWCQHLAPRSFNP